MDNRIQQSLTEIHQEFALGYVSVPEAIQEVFSFRPESELSHTESQTLSKYTLVLSQYLISLQVRINESRVNAAQLKKVFEKRLADISRTASSSKSTLKEREARAIVDYPELQELDSALNEAVAIRDYLEGLDKPIIEYINSLKSELRRRAEERERSR